MKLGARVLRHRALLLLALGVTTAAGLYTAQTLPSGVYPEVDFPRIVVVARAGGLPADVFTTQVTRPLEDELVTVLGVRSVRSRTLRGSCEVSLTFVAGTDMETALQHVSTQLGRVRAQLPPGAELDVERLTPTAFPVVTFNLAGPIDPRTLAELARYVVRPAFARVPGVGLVKVIGGEQRELEVVLDPVATRAATMGPLEVATRLRAATALGASGWLREDAQQIPLVVSGEVLDAEDLARVPIALSAGGTPVELGALAHVEESFADPTSRVGGPLGSTVIVSVSRLPGASTPSVVRAVERVALELRDTLPRGVSLVPVYDQADLVEESLGSVREAIALGIALCLVLLGLSLRDLRAGAFAAATVPIVLAGTFLVMRALGSSLNLMSLGGMAVAVGLIIDDAIIVLEAIARRMEEGESAERAVTHGVDDIGPAVLGTTLTTVAVFVPLGFVGGVVGEFFAALAVPLAAAVLLSWVVSLTGLPIAARWLRPRPHAAEPPRLERVYRRIAGFGAARPYLGPVLLAASLLVGWLALQHVESGFLPSLDEGAFVLDYYLPPGTSLEQSDHSARALEQLLRTTPEVQTYSRRTGAELGPAAATSENKGDIMVRLVPRARRTQSADEVAAGLRARIAAAVPEVRVEFVRVLEDVLNDLSGAPHPIEVKLFGDDPARLAALAADVAARVEPIDGLVDLYDGVEGDLRTRVVRVDRAAAARAGIAAQDVLDQVAAARVGVLAGAVREHDRLIPIRVRHPDALRFDGESVLELPIVLGAHARSVPLGALAQLEAQSVPIELTREDLRGVVVVSAATEGRDLGAVVTDVRAALRGLSLPAGYRMELDGQAAAQAESFTQLALVGGLGFLLILLLLVAQFRRLRPALAVLATAPFALAGALVALALTGTPLDASSLMGLILLVGLEVKAGILLLEVAEAHAEAGAPYVRAIELACARRIRPIMMTATATLAGVLPLALEQGAGAEIQRPLAIAVLGGIGLSKFVVLVALPALATLLEGKGARTTSATPRP